MTQGNAAGLHIITQIASLYRDAFLRREAIFTASCKAGAIGSMRDIIQIHGYDTAFEYQRLDIVMDSMFEAYTALINVYPETQEIWERVTGDLYNQAIDQAVRNSKAS